MRGVDVKQHKVITTRSYRQTTVYWYTAVQYYHKTIP